VNSRLSSTRARILAVIALAMATLSAGASSLALLTDTATLNQKDVIAVVDLSLNGQTTLNIPDRVWYQAGSSYVPFEVRNQGNADLRYAIQSTATGGTLDNELQVTARANGSSTFCNAVDFTTQGANIGATNVTPSNFDIGSPSQGAQTNDRQLTAGQTEWLCLKVTLPVGYTATGENSWTSTFFAEQTANNP